MMDSGLEYVPEEHLKKFATLLDRASFLGKAEAAQNDFMTYCKMVWPEFVNGRHHGIMAEKFNRLATGDLKRLIVNMPPRHTKSEFGSYLLPSWLMGKRPTLKIMQTTHTAELAFRFGRKTRNLMNSQDYRGIFDVELRADSQAAGRWETSKGGEYFAAGVGGAVTGRGADLLIIDDPHSEQDALSPTALEHAYEWYTSGPRQRLQPGGSIVIIMTRWAENDLTGKLLRQQARDVLADKWEVVEFPALMPETNKPLWPEYWKKEDLLAVKGSLSVGKWEAQWQQNPTSEGAAILKREWWQEWKKEDLPNLDYVMQSYDTAYSKKESADYSAITTWGVFYPYDGAPANIILVDAQRGRWDFPDLRRKALEEYKYWDPECVLIEAKASGMPLTQELRNMGIPVQNYSPSRGNDKHTRVNSIAPLLESALVWAPDTRWAEEVIEECAAFPAGEHDDYVDTVTQALRRFREGGFIQHPEDYEDEESAPRIRSYY